MNRIAVVLSIGSGVFALLAAPALAVPLSTAFTYQGRLQLNGEPVGPVDLEFTLFDAASGGNMVAGPLGVKQVEHVEGVFTVELDFGPVAFDGQARWLAVAVAAPAGSGTYVPLEPRQVVTAAPYALYALNAPGGAGGFWAANGSHIYNTNSGNVGIGTTIPAARLDVKSPSSVKAVIGNVSPGFSADLVTGGIICSGSTSPSAQGMYLSAFGGVPRVGAIRIGGAAVPPLTFQIDNAEKMRIAPDGNVGIGTTGPAERLHIHRSAVLFDDPTVTTALISQQTRDTVSAHNATAELELAATRDFGPFGSPIVASGMLAVHNLASGARRLSLNAQDAGMTLDLRTQGVDRLSIAADGNVGVGTDVPDARLHVLTAQGDAVHGQTSGSGGSAVLGEATAMSGVTNGVEGRSASASGRGVLGIASAASGFTFGVYGEAISPSGTAVFGQLLGQTGTSAAIHGKTNSLNGMAVRAQGAGPTGTALTIESGAIRVPGAGLHTATPAFVVEGNSSNILKELESGRDLGILIDHPITNNDSSAILFATQQAMGTGPTFSWLRYDVVVAYWEELGRWLLILVDLDDSQGISLTGRRYHILVIKTQALGGSAPALGQQPESTTGVGVPAASLPVGIDIAGHARPDRRGEVRAAVRPVRVEP